MPIIDKRGVNQRRDYQVVISYLGTARRRLRHIYWCKGKDEKEAQNQAETFALLANLPSYEIESINSL